MATGGGRDTAGTGGGRESVTVDGRTIRFTHPDKVLYPATGTTKADVLHYLTEVAPVLVRHAADRPVTRKRWPDGTGEESFFEKNLPSHAPDWLDTVNIRHSDRTVTYPLVDSPAVLAWFAQQAALELHVPQWTIEDGEPGKTSRIVIDLDPGVDVDLDTTARVALRVRELLDSVGLPSWPVTSGSKGIHLYARLDTPVTSRGASRVARQIATSLATSDPDLVTATMARSARAGKVFVDWSQNNAAKTTVAPYSLRGRDEPWVAAPRTWDELAAGGLSQVHAEEVLDRLETFGDLLEELAEPGTTGPVAAVADAHDDAGVVTHLAEYRRKRNENRTPEPFGSESPGDGEPEADRPRFVIQEHHARRLHYDFRLEREGVLVSWAVPKNLPDEPRDRRLAIQTEDHPLSYAGFEGEIPKGEYGAGTVEIWDSGSYTSETWEDDEIIVRLDGDHVSGRYVLVRTDAEKRQWIVQYMLDQAGGADSPWAPSSGTEADTGSASPTHPEAPLPMIPTSGTVTSLPVDEWAFEGKWDGYRVVVTSSGEDIRLYSRNGTRLDGPAGRLPDLADRFPGLGEAIGRSGVLDGELVVLGPSGVPDFGALAREFSGEPASGALHLFLFDVLELDGTRLRHQTWEKRREILDALAPRLKDVEGVRVPGLLDGPGDRALADAEELGWEGVVAKRRSSRYQSGRRTKSWLKEKLLTTTEAVVGGWRPGKGARSGSVGSLLLGLPAERGLTYIGRVGTGFSDRQGRSLRRELEKLERKTSPFTTDLPADARRTAVWSRPQLVVEVRHQGFSDDGVLRQASFRGVRDDKLPGDL